MTLAPTLQSGAPIEQAVQQPSALAGVASIAGSFVQAITPPQPTEAERNRAREEGLNRDLQTSLRRAQGLRDQGRNREADRLERRSFTDYQTRGGNLGSTGTQALIRAETGRDFEDVGFSSEELARQDILESPEYGNFLASTFVSHPDATPEERQDIAVMRTMGYRANLAVIEQTRVEWNGPQGQASRIELVRNWNERNMGILTLADQQGRKITNDTVQQTNLEFANFRTQMTLSRPQGVPDSEWEPIEDSLDRTQAAIDIALSLTSPEEIRADLMMSVTDSILAMDNVSDHEKNAFIQTLTRNPEVLIEQGIIPLDRLQSVLRSAINTDPAANLESLEGGNRDPSNITGGMGSETFTQAELDAAAETDPSEAFKRASDLALAAGAVPNVINDPDSKGQWIALTRTGLAGLYSMASEQNAYASAEGYRKFFTPSFFSTMDSLRNSGSTFEYDAMRNKSIEAIDTNLSTLRANIQSTVDRNPQAPSGGRRGTRREGFTYDEASNTLLYNGNIVTRNTSREMTRRGLRGGNTRYVTGLLDKMDAINQLRSFKDRLPPSDEGSVINSSEGSSQMQGNPADDQTSGNQGGDQLSPADTHPATQVSDRILLARTLQAEAGNQGFQGMIDVGSVIRNRVASGRWGDSLRGVILADGQFSAWNSVTGYARGEQGQNMGFTPNEEALAAADAIISGDYNNRVGDALNYFAVIPGVSPRPSWANESFVQFGDHHFGTAGSRGADGSSIELNVSEETGETQRITRPLARPEGLRGSVGGAEEPSPSSGTPTPQQQDAAPTASEDELRVLPRGEEPSAERMAQATNEWDQLEQQTKRLLLRLFGNEEAVIEALATGELSEEDL